jgi:predicted XRE-type DNA-binding protein
MPMVSYVGIARDNETSMSADDPIPALKRQLAQLLVERVEGWSQTYAADLLGTDQPRLSNLRRGQLERFSLEQLVRFVARVEGIIELQVTWTNRRAYLFARSRLR